MSKIAKSNPGIEESSALEIIELAIDDLETLTRAFNVIKDVCDELNNPHLSIRRDIKESLIN